eukprot:g8616.t1
MVETYDEQLSADEVEYRSVLDGLIPLVSSVIDEQGGCCSLGLIMNNEKITDQLSKIPAGFDKKLAKILKYYHDYFAILDNGMVATHMGYETGKVHAETNERNKRGGTNSTSDMARRQEQLGNSREVQEAADRLWAATFDIGNEARFQAALEKVMTVRARMWEKGVTAFPMPGGSTSSMRNSADGSYNGGGGAAGGYSQHGAASSSSYHQGSSGASTQHHAGGSQYGPGGSSSSSQTQFAGGYGHGGAQFGGPPVYHHVYLPEEREAKIVQLGQACVDYLRESQEHTAPLNHLASSPEIAALKKGVIAKFEKWIRSLPEVFEVTEVQHTAAIQRCLQVGLVLLPNQRGEYVFPSDNASVSGAGGY